MIIYIWLSFKYHSNPFSITVIRVYIPTTDAEEAEVDQFYEDLQHFLEHLLELTTPKNVLFIIGDLKAKVGCQEIRRITGKFGLGV